MQRTWPIIILLAAVMGLNGVHARAGVTDATPVEVGYDGMVFEADTTHNVVMRIPVSADAQGDTLIAATVGNAWWDDEPASEPADIAANTVRLWYAAADTGSLNTTTAQYVGALTFFSWRGYPAWSAGGLNLPVGDGGALYVTVDITASPTSDVACRFHCETSDLQFASGYWPAMMAPSLPPRILVVPNFRADTLEAWSEHVGQIVLSTGQDFEPLRLHLTHPGVPLSAPIFLAGLTLTVQDGTGTVLAPNTVLTSLGVRDLGGNGQTSLITSLPGSPQGVFVPLHVTVTVFEGDHPLEVFGTVASNTATAGADFRLVWNDGADLAAYDGLVGVPAAVVPAAGSFPFASELLTIQAAATEVRVYHTPVLADGSVVYKGQTGVNPVNFTFVNPGDSGTARADVTRLTLAVTDADGTTLSPAAVFSRVAVGGDVFHGETTSMPSAGSLITVTLTHSFVSVPAYQPVTATVGVDIRSDATATDFRLALASASAVSAQDANSLEPLTVSQAFASDPFPMTGPIVRLSSSLFVSGASLAPRTAYPGQRTAFLDLAFDHPGPADMGLLLLRGLTLTARDQHGQALAWSAAAQSLHVMDAGRATLAERDALPAGAEIYLALPDVTVSPFTTARLTIEVRLHDDPETESLALGIDAAAAVDVIQQNDPGRPVFVAGTWPVRSDAATLGGGEGALRLSNYPNPFSPRRGPTRIAYYLEGPATVSAKVFTLGGDEVCGLAAGALQLTGENTLLWDGRTASGAVVVNGVYLLRIEAVRIDTGDEHVQLRKIAVVK